MEYQNLQNPIAQSNISNKSKSLPSEGEGYNSNSQEKKKEYETEKLKSARIYVLFIIVGYCSYAIISLTSMQKYEPPFFINVILMTMNAFIIINLIVSYKYIKIVYILMYQA